MEGRAVTDLTGPALLRAAAERLNDGVMYRCVNCDHTLSMHSEGGCWYTLTDGPEGEDLVCRCRASKPPAEKGIVPHLAAWLHAFSYEAEGLGWVNPDGTWKLGSLTNYSTAIARKVINQ
jgi:hypothetical protein